MWSTSVQQRAQGITTPPSPVLVRIRAIVVDDKIFVLGAYNGIKRLSSVESFTPGSQVVWHHVPNMIYRRSNFSASLMEGKLMVAGGYKINFELGEVEGNVCGDV